MKTLQQYKAEQMTDEEFRRAYEELRLEQEHDDKDVDQKVAVHCIIKERQSFQVAVV